MLPALLGVLGAAIPVASRVLAVAALARSDAARAQAGFLLTACPAEVPARALAQAGKTPAQREHPAGVPGCFALRPHLFQK